ncbi:MAG TPA: hypothetical protein VM532_15855 [Burkholderiales bacterium]|nr:hypothetical protein [Burkholderiales bacterium]
MAITSGCSGDISKPIDTCHFDAQVADYLRNVASGKGGSWIQ